MDGSNCEPVAAAKEVSMDAAIAVSSEMDGVWRTALRGSIGEKYPLTKVTMALVRLKLNNG